MKYKITGLPNDVFRYLNPPVGDFGKTGDEPFSSFGELIEVLEDYRTTYPEGKGVQKIDLGTL